MRLTQRQLLPRLVEHLTDNGHLMLGHSENLHWLTDLLKSHGQYRLPTQGVAPRVEGGPADRVPVPLRPLRLRRPPCRRGNPLWSTARPSSPENTSRRPAHGNLHRPGFVRGGVPLRSGGPHRRHEPLHAAGVVSESFRLGPLRRPRHGTADQRDHVSWRRPPPLAGQGVWRFQRAVSEKLDG